MPQDAELFGVVLPADCFQPIGFCALGSGLGRRGFRVSTLSPKPQTLASGMSFVSYLSVRYPTYHSPLITTQESPSSRNDSWKVLITSLLGGSWVVISGVISPLIRVIITATLLITPLITTHEPPSRACSRLLGLGP